MLTTLQKHYLRTAYSLYKLRKALQQHPMINEEFFHSYDNDFNIIQRVWTDLGMKEDNDIILIRDYYSHAYSKEVDYVKTEDEYIGLIYDIFLEYCTDEDADEGKEKQKIYNIYTDGATVGHNGKLGTVSEVGLGIYNKTTGEKVSLRVKGLSNNEAEFIALIEAIERCIKKGYKKVNFYLDSTVVVNRASNKKKVGSGGKKKNERMDLLQQAILDKLHYFEEVTFNWIPREQNSIADKLSKKAI